MARPNALVMSPAGAPASGGSAIEPVRPGGSAQSFGAAQSIGTPGAFGTTGALGTTGASGTTGAGVTPPPGGANARRPGTVGATSSAGGSRPAERVKSPETSLAPAARPAAPSGLRDFASYSPRERILAAALKLFVEQGYFNTNVPDLSRESKCSVGSIYHTFKNKEQVAAALYQEGISAFRSALLGSLDDRMETVELVRSVVGAFLQFCEVNQQLSRYLWLSRHNEFMTGSIKHPTSVGFDKLGRILTRSLKKAMREGKIRPMDAALLWSILFGIPVAYVRDWLEGHISVSPTQRTDEIADACWRALKA